MIAKTMAELEDVLAEELVGLGANNIQIGTRMVSFTGDKTLMYKANLHCRTALHILKPIHSFKAENADEVYEAVKQLDWDNYLSIDKTFAVDSVVFSHIFHHSKFVAYRVKDAIADYFTEKYGKRPSVSVSNPDLVFNIHVAHNKCTLSLDSSGESLHKRGYRVAQTEAPLNEVLAAGMVLKSGWRGESVFFDPMCGSGTLIIEAAMVALGIPPGIHREHFAFENWPDFDRELFSAIYNDDSGSRECSQRIIGSDISPKAIAIAERNIKSAGLTKYIDLQVKPFQQYTEAPASKGVLMTNPPYGERIKIEELEPLYAMIGERLKHVFTGYEAYILSYKKECFDSIGLKPTRRFFLFNGALECEMREYEIFAGKRNLRPREEKHEQHPRDDKRERYPREDRIFATSKPEEKRTRPPFKPKSDKRDETPKKRFFRSDRKDS
ncbi:MAG: THUMP domain-containing protein [Dysgonamonadaceae bacterium]|nr:THUMP domain-containing protein [Dysgonamonadaceae bacterium]